MTRKIKYLGGFARCETARTTSRNLGSRAAVLIVLGCLLTLPISGYPETNVTFSYDSIGRVVSVAYMDGTKTTTVTYTYDASGNLTGTIIK